MSVGSHLLTGVIAGGLESFNEVLESGLTEKYFLGGAERDAFEFILNHFMRYGVLPQAEIVEAETDHIFIDSPEQPIRFYIQQVKDRKLTVYLMSRINEANNSLRNGNIENTKSIFLDTSHKIANLDTRTRTQSFSDLMPEVINEHERVQQCRGEAGIPIGLPFIDAMLNGIQGTDTIALVASPGCGKTYIATKAAISAAQAGFRTLFFPLEMPNLQMGRRGMALRTRTNATRLRLGTISTVAMDHLRRYMEMIQASGEGDRLLFHEGNLRLTTSDVRIKIQQYQPRFVVIDGAYMLHSANTGKFSQKWERSYEVMEEIRRICLVEGVPIFATYQYDINASNDKGLGGIRGGQVIAQFAPIVFHLYNDLERSELNYESIDYKILQIIKGREGENAKISLAFLLSQGIIEQQAVLEGGAFLNGGIGQGSIEGDYDPYSGENYGPDPVGAGEVTGNTNTNDIG